MDMELLERHNVTTEGRGQVPMVFAHGFGCDQHMWRLVAPAFADTHRLIMFDHLGAGKSDLSAYDRVRHGSLEGYADDVVALCREMGVRDGVFVGHSVSAMIGIMAHLKAPELFESLVLVGPSPRYIDDGDYRGGFTAQQIDELLQLLDSNHMGWSQQMAPVIMGNPERPELGDELTNSFCQTDPEIAKQFARVTFLSDNRQDLPKVRARTLVLQCSEDVIAPREVGEYVHRMIPGSQLVVMRATGHCPNLSAPDETVQAIRGFL